MLAKATGIHELAIMAPPRNMIQKIEGGLNVANKSTITAINTMAIRPIIMVCLSPFPFFPIISSETDVPINDRNVVAEDIPAASTPVRRMIPSNFGIMFIAAHIITRDESGISGLTTFTNTADIPTRNSRANTPMAAQKADFTTTVSFLAIK